MDQSTPLDGDSPSSMDGVSPSSMDELKMGAEMEEMPTASLSEVMASRNHYLHETELWALCRECCLTLEYVHDCVDLFMSLCISPDTVAFDPEGNVCFLDLDMEPDPMFVSPEAGGNSYKSHLFSLGMTLLYVTEFNTRSADPQAQLSDAFTDLLASLTNEDVDLRPDLEAVLSACSAGLKGQDSQEICLRIVGLDKQETSDVTASPVLTNTKKDFNDNCLTQTDNGNCLKTVEIVQTQTTQVLSLADLLTRLDRDLSERELWSLCNQSLSSLRRKKKHLPAYISVETLLIGSSGCVTFQPIPEDTPLQVFYMAPELQERGILNEKTCLFGLGKTLLAAAGNQRTETVEVLIQALTHKNPEQRPDLGTALRLCQEFDLANTSSSQQHCENLYKSAIGVRASVEVSVRASVENKEADSSMLEEKSASAFKPASNTSTTPPTLFKPVPRQANEPRVPSAFSSPATHFRPIVIQEAQRSAGQRSEGQRSAGADTTVVAKLKQIKENLSRHREPGKMVDTSGHVHAQQTQHLDHYSISNQHLDHYSHAEELASAIAQHLKSHLMRAPQSSGQITSSSPPAYVLPQPSQPSQTYLTTATTVHMSTGNSRHPHHTTVFSTAAMQPSAVSNSRYQFSLPGSSNLPLPYTYLQDSATGYLLPFPSYPPTHPSLGGATLPHYSTALVEQALPHTVWNNQEHFRLASGHYGGGREPDLGPGYRGGREPDLGPGYRGGREPDLGPGYRGGREPDLGPGYRGGREPDQGPVSRNEKSLLHNSKTAHKTWRGVQDSNTSSPSPSKDSGICLTNPQYPSESLMDKLLASTHESDKQDMLHDVLKVIHQTFSEDGILDNGLDDIALAQYILTLSGLTLETFCSAVTEKYFHLVWPYTTLRQLYTASGGQTSRDTRFSSTSPAGGAAHKHADKGQHPNGFKGARSKKTFTPLKTHVRNHTANQILPAQFPLANHVYHSDSSSEGRVSVTESSSRVSVTESANRVSVAESASRVSVNSNKSPNIEVMSEARRRHTGHPSRHSNHTLKVAPLRSSPGVDQAHTDHRHAPSSTVLQEGDLGQAQHLAHLQNVPSTAGGASHSTATGASHSTATGASHSTATGASHSTATGASHSTATGASHSTATGASHSTATGASHSTTTGASHSTATDASHSTATGASHSTATGASHSTATGASHNMTELKSSTHPITQSNSKSYENKIDERKIEERKIDGEEEIDLSTEMRRLAASKPELFKEMPPAQVRPPAHRATRPPSQVNGRRTSTERQESQDLQTHFIPGDSHGKARSTMRPSSRLFPAPEQPTRTFSAVYPGVKVVDLTNQTTARSRPASRRGSEGNILDDVNMSLLGYRRRGDVVYHSAMIQLSLTSEVDHFIHSIDEENQASIERRLASISQEVLVLKRQRKKTQKFYSKLSSSKLSKGDENVQEQMLKDMQENTKKLTFLHLCQTHLKMLLAELSGLETCFLYSLSATEGGGALSLEPHPDNPYLQFRTISSPESGRMSVLQAGTPRGLMAYLFTSSALSNGFIHQFLMCYRYILTADQLLQFILEKYYSTLSQPKDANIQRVRRRSLDLLTFWLEGYFSVDFKANPKLIKQLADFVQQQVDEKAEGADNLQSLMAACTRGDNCELMLMTEMDEDQEEEHVYFLHLTTPKRSNNQWQLEWDSFRSLLKNSKTEKMNFGVISRRTNSVPKLSGGQSGGQSGGHFSLSDCPPHNLAEQLCLIEQDLFRKCHPVHFLNSQFHGVGVALSMPGLRTPSMTRKSESASGQKKGLFVGDPVTGSEILAMISHSQELAHWVSAEILSCGTNKTQSVLVIKFLSVAKMCLNVRNFASALSILDGLENLVVRQLAVWKNIPAKYLAYMDELTNVKMKLKSEALWLMSEKDCHIYPCIPSILYSLLQLQQLEIGSFTLANGMYKWDKIRSICEAVDQFRIFRDHEYGFQPDLDLQMALQRSLSEYSDRDLHAVAAVQGNNFSRHSGSLAGTLRKVKDKLYQKKK
ncbi:kinase non-catalytic C-lobe domain-containing protein 1-like [Physella acuta]|uniref:kinase non-catalytic C-lobe domain-containing protein 1-like n=1 Tax=Physella acuta TaxID=109671 RepID=UPI0027DC48E7|nr:kinase non-catalytic C-lobe domain-containing protein 1-like [Physella acuta]